MSDSSNVFNHRVAEADRHCQVESFEEAIRALDLAEASKSSIPTDEKVLLAKKRGNIERCKGNNDGSIALLLTAISLNGNFTNLTHVELIGELGAVYLNKDEYENAQEQFIEQHRLAQTLIQGADDRSTKIAAQVQACRAIGNLGLAKIQCAMAMPAEARTVMYKHAIRYLEMRVTIARNILQDIDVKGDPGDYRPMVAEWQSLGLDRLAFCHTAIGDHHRAISCGEAAIELANKAHDPSMLAFSRFYYGNALQAAGSIEEAIHQWNPEGDLCTPAIAFCKQPSEESCRNLRKLRSLAVGFDGCDEFGYSALDYAVLAGLDKYAALVMRGLRDELDMRYPDDEAEVEHQVDLRKAEARRRKHYRETFQTTFRPRLSQEQEKTSAEKCIAELRELYAHDLRWDLRKQEVLDTFNFLSYTSFKALGHLPNPGDTDGMERLRKQTRDDSLKRSQDSKNTPYVIFFSYEWRGKSPAEPDDESKTQYSRMKDAIEQLLKNPGELTGIPDLTEDRISIWLDIASVDQTNQEPGAQDRGISALPLVIAQCNMMISLVDDAFFTRARCAVEVLMMQRLQSYGHHRYLEHSLSASDSMQGSLVVRDRLEELRDIAGNPSKYAVTREEDRASIRYLVRQSELLQKQDAVNLDKEVISE